MSPFKSRRNYCNFCDRVICTTCKQQCNTLAVDSKQYWACNECYAELRPGQGLPASWYSTSNVELNNSMKEAVKRASPGPGHRFLASLRRKRPYRDSPVMLRLLKEIWDAQPDNQ